MATSQLCNPQSEIRSCLMLVTQYDLMQPSFDEALQQALQSGAKLIQLREKNPMRVLELARSAATLCEKYSAQLQINCGEESLKIARELKLGVHLPEREFARKARDVLGKTALIGQSVHTVETARQAESSGANYLVYGSVFPTNSHPGEAAAGLENLQKVTQAVSLPVFAIGGIDARNAALCLQHGAHGIAVISAVWRSQNISDAVKELQNSLLAHD